jgi:hypothetical protein
MARRDNYNTGIEQLMTILMKVQSDEAQKRKLFNLKYGRNIVLTSPSLKLRQTAPVIYFEQ